MRRAVPLLSALVLALAGCGGDGAEDEVVSTVEEAAGVDLRRGKPPGNVIERVYSSADSGLIQVFVLSGPEQAAMLEDQAPPARGVRTVRHENVVVIVGGPKSDDVVEAVEAL